MELASILSTTFERAMRRLRAINSAFPVKAEASAGWHKNPMIARDKGDYLLHTIVGR